MSRVSRLVAVGVSVSALLGLAVLTAPSGLAGDGGRHFLVDKVVEGTQPAGAEYRISFTCVEEGDIPDPQQVVLNGPGNAVDAIIPPSKLETTCTVTEPVDGGATTVTFTCQDDGITSCNAPNSVTYPDGDEISTATITVTNTFEEPAPPEPVAEAITTEPAFTG